MSCSHNDENDKCQSNHSNVDVDEEEKEHFEAVIGAMAFYESSSEMQWQRLARHFSKLPPYQQQLLSKIPTENSKYKYVPPPERFKLLRLASVQNQQFLNTVLSKTGSFLNHHDPVDPKEILMRESQPIEESRNPLSGFNAEKVHSTLYQLAREWSQEGSEERNQCFTPLLSALESRLPVNQTNRYKQKVFCPGSGLGRLPFEICMRGYSSLANEFSYFMLIMSNFILNSTKNAFEFSIHPWIHQICNVRDSAAQLSAVKIPDVDPKTLPPDSDFGCAAGDFLEIASEEKESWDAVVTCFFIDTANNVIDYMEAIYSMLKPGGYWINLGPLLYHYTDMPHEFSLELTLDQLLHAATQIGFEIQEQKTIPCNYTLKKISMMQTLYQAEFWVAKK